MEITLVGNQQVDQALAAFPRKATRAMVRSLNRAIDSCNTVMVRSIAADTGLKSGDVRKALKVRYATDAKPESRLAASLKRLPLIQFNARGPEPSRGRGRGVSYRLPTGSGRIPNAFIATMASGHRGVFVRKGTARLPIREAFGPSLGHVFAKYRPNGIERAREAFMQNFARELKFEQSQSVGAD